MTLHPVAPAIRKGATTNPPSLRALSDIATRAAEKILREGLAKSGGKLVDEAIRDLPGRLN